MQSDLAWSRKEMMAQLGCGDLTLQELTRRHNNPIPSLKVGNRLIYPKQRVTDWLNGNPAMPTPLRMVA